MRRKWKAIFLILILCLVAVFAIVASGIRIPFFENYGTNFRRNVKSIVERFEWQVPEQMEEFLNQTPRPLTMEEKLEILEQMEEEEAKQQQEEQERLQQEQEQTEQEAKQAAGEAVTAPTLVPVTPAPTKRPENPDAENSNIVALKSAYSADYAAYKGNVLCATVTNLYCYNPKGEILWNKEIQVSNPILCVADRYILVAEQNGVHFYLFDREKQVYAGIATSPIVSAAVSEHGDVVLTSQKAHYRGTVTVYNREGKEVFCWNSGSYGVLDADISPSSRTLAVSLMCTENGISTRIHFFHLDEAESYASCEYADTILFDLRFFSETLTAVGDNRIVGISTKGSEVWNRSFEDSILERYVLEDGGHKLCVLDHSNHSELLILNNRGSERSILEAEALPDFADIQSGYVAYNNGRDLIYTTVSGKDTKKYVCSRDIKKIILIDTGKVLIVYNSGLEFLEL